MDRLARRLSYVFLCAVPLINIILVAVRDLRLAGVFQVVGGIAFAAVCVSAWILGARSIATDTDARRELAVAGVFLLAPTALMSLLWVGLGTPWDATAAENRMRYLVLLAGSIAVTVALVILAHVLRERGERLYSALGFAANMMAGAAYLIWTTFQVGAWSAKARTGSMPPLFASLGETLDTLLFAACVLTYLATAAFAASLGRVHWLGCGAARAYVIVSSLALLFIVMRGLSFPDPTANNMPWYVRPGFIAGIPAVPWIMPYLHGVVLLRRAGDGPAGGGPA